MAKVDGANTTVKPLIKPKKAPQIGPYKIAPSAIGIRDKLILTGPIVIKLPTICNTISMAVKTPVAAIIFVEKEPFFKKVVFTKISNITIATAKAIINLIQS